MALKYHDNVRNIRLDAIEVTIGTLAKLRIYNGTKPANCEAAAAGTMLCEMVLPSDWMSAAASGVKSKLGTWTGTGVAAGNATYFRIYNNAGSTCHVQGTAGTSGDLVLDAAPIAVGQTVTVTAVNITGSNA